MALVNGVSFLDEISDSFSLQGVLDETCGWVGGAPHAGCLMLLVVVGYGISVNQHLRTLRKLVSPEVGINGDKAVVIPDLEMGQGL